jgi:hypothetical protein
MIAETVPRGSDHGPEVGELGRAVPAPAGPVLDDPPGSAEGTRRPLPPSSPGPRTPPYPDRPASRRSAGSSADPCCGDRGWGAARSRPKPALGRPGGFPHCRHRRALARPRRGRRLNPNHRATALELLDRHGQARMSTARSRALASGRTRASGARHPRSPPRPPAFVPKQSSRLAGSRRALRRAGAAARRCASTEAESSPSARSGTGT